MAELFDSFPSLQNDRIIIRKMEEKDVDALTQITDNSNVYRYIPPFLYKKSKGNLLAAIRNLGGRDFDKKKMIISGIYLCQNPDFLVGLAEMFDYKKSASRITIGYRINEAYWRQGIATNAVHLMVQYLSSVGIHTIQAFVMPENAHSVKALQKNGFQKEDALVQEKNWGGQDIVNVEVYTYRI